MNDTSTIHALLDSCLKRDFTAVAPLSDALEEAGHVAHAQKLHGWLTRTKPTPEQLTEELFRSRQDRRNHPDGAFDSAKRWKPSSIEDPDGTIRSTIRTPSRAHPFSYMVACRTKKHCKKLVEVCLETGQGPQDLLDLITGWVLLYPILVSILQKVPVD